MAEVFGFTEGTEKREKHHSGLALSARLVSTGMEEWEGCVSIKSKKQKSNISSLHHVLLQETAPLSHIL